MSQNAKQELVDYLDRKAFKPVLNASPAEHSGSEKKLQHAQEATRREQERFRNYGSAQEVVDNFKDDLSSEPAKKVQRELRSLDLPTLPDVEEGFRKKAEELGLDY